MKAYCVEVEEILEFSKYSQHLTLSYRGKYSAISSINNQNKNKIYSFQRECFIYFRRNIIQLIAIIILYLFKYDNETDLITVFISSNLYRTNTPEYMN